VEIWIGNYVNFHGDKVGNGKYMDSCGNFERAATAIVLTDIIYQSHKHRAYESFPGLYFDGCSRPAARTYSSIGDPASPN